jgi:hypothetical protein
VFPEIYEDFMSSAVISTSAALGRPFIFDAEPEPEVCSPSSPSLCGDSRPRLSVAAQVFHSTIKNQQSKIPPGSVLPASQLGIRPAPEMASSGIPALDALTGGLPRGCLTELCGPASSGRTTVLLAALAAATRRGEFCALIDASDALDPHSAAAAGIDLDRLLWVRCDGNSPPRHRDTEKQENQKKGCAQTVFDFDRTGSRQSERRLEQVLRTTDLLLESGGFGLIVLDLADLPMQAARRIPLTTWFRFRRAVEHKPTILLAIEQHPIAGSCSSLLLQLGVLSAQYSVLSDQAADVERHSPQDLQPAHARLFTGLNINVELTHSRLERKPARAIAFETKTAWAG